MLTTVASMPARPEPRMQENSTHRPRAEAKRTSDISLPATRCSLRGSRPGRLGQPTVPEIDAVSCRFGCPGRDPQIGSLRTMRIVVALGGKALRSPEPSFREAAAALAPIAERHQLIVCHDN